MSEQRMLERDIGTHGGTYDDNVVRANRLAKIKEILSGWYIDKPGGTPFRVVAETTGTVMRTYRGEAIGLTSAEEVIGLVLLRWWRRLYGDEEREAMATMGLGRNIEKA